MARRPPPSHQAPALAQARDRLRHIIRALKEVLSDLQLVTELVAKAEAQKQADEEQIRQLEQSLTELEGRQPQRSSYRPHPQPGN